MLELFHYDFMLYGFMAAVLVGIGCGLIGPLVVSNRQVFLAGGIAHAAYGGVGLAFFWSLPVMPVVLIYSVLVALVFSFFYLTQRKFIEPLVGMVWAGGMALGILLLDFSGGYQVDLFSYLFGSILTVSKIDLCFMLGVDVLVLTLFWWKYKELVVLSFDFEYAKSLGLPVNVLYTGLVVFLALVVVMLIQVVGLILVVALLSIPTYLARQWSKNLLTMCWWTGLLATTFSLGGLVLSFYLNLTASGAIIGLAVISFILAESKRWLLNFNY